MKISKYNLEVCQVCYRFKGSVEEEHNGLVPVFCMCDVRDRKHIAFNPRMQGGVITNGSVLLRFMPISDYIGDDGTTWHSSYLSGFGWGCGRSQDLDKLLAFVKENNSPVTEQALTRVKMFLREIPKRFFLWDDSTWRLFRVKFEKIMSYKVK